VALQTATTREATAEGKASPGLPAADLLATNNDLASRLSSGYNRELPWLHNHNMRLLQFTIVLALLGALVPNNNFANL
jgi:hypothetical protein